MGRESIYGSLPVIPGMWFSVGACCYPVVEPALTKLLVQYWEGPWLYTHPVVIPRTACCWESDRHQIHANLLLYYPPALKILIFALYLSYTGFVSPSVSLVFKKAGLGSGKT